VELLEPLLLWDDEPERPDELEVVGQEAREGTDVGPRLGFGEVVEELADLLAGQASYLPRINGWG